MDTTVPPHEAHAARLHPKRQTGLSWSDFFQSLGQGEPASTPSAKSTPVGRFATSA